MPRATHESSASAKRSSSNRSSTSSAAASSAATASATLTTSSPLRAPTDHDNPRVGTGRAHPTARRRRPGDPLTGAPPRRARRPRPPRRRRRQDAHRGTRGTARRARPAAPPARIAAHQRTAAGRDRSTARVRPRPPPRTRPLQPRRARRPLRDTFDISVTYDKPSHSLELAATIAAELVPAPETLHSGAATHMARAGSEPALAEAQLSKWSSPSRR